jgi:pimeloyl-ACP methyl ester carboxylesterase
MNNFATALSRPEKITWQELRSKRSGDVDCHRFASRVALHSRLAIAAIMAFCTAAPAHAWSFDCPIGTYRLADESAVDIGVGDGGHLRWRRDDGTSGELTSAGPNRWTSTLGWTGRSDGKSLSFNCSRGTIDFAGTPGKRILFDVTETRFEGAGVTLVGRLVMPKGNRKVPIVVLVHGSEHDSARDVYALQRLFPSQGIGAFVYDKRGTGSSGGKYTQDYLLLADDAIAAAREARRLGGGRVKSLGYQAGSQGGWVAPLAARIERVDFVVVGFGLAVSPLDEDREAVALDVTRHGYGPDVMAKAMEVADATAEVLLSDFREGYDKLEAVKKAYSNEPWFKYLHGDVTFALLKMTPAELRATGPALLPGVPFQYDPMPVLRNLDTPQLWILGTDDFDAPSAETARRLKALEAAGRSITIALFPHAEHGIYEYETAVDGTRLSTRQPDGYLRMMRDFIVKGRIAANYGTARIFEPAARQRQH